jgi:hypothetical protein
VASVEYTFAPGCWTLLGQNEGRVEKTTDALGECWQNVGTGRTLLIFDAFSMREAPWLLGNFVSRGYRMHSARATGVELPGLHAARFIDGVESPQPA